MMMNLKACCGLWATKEDEDHDYYEDSEDPLPKPKNESERAEHFKSLPGYMVPVAPPPSLSIKMPKSTSSAECASKVNATVSRTRRVESRSIPPRRRSNTSSCRRVNLETGRPSPRRRRPHNENQTDSASSSSTRGLLSATSTTTTVEQAIEKASWDAGAGSAASTPSHPQQKSSPSFWEASVPTSQTILTSARARNSTSITAAPSSKQDAINTSGNGRKHRRAGSSGYALVERGVPSASTSLPATGGDGASGLPGSMTVSASEGARVVTAGGSGGDIWAGEGRGTAATRRQSDFDLATFVDKLHRGVLLTKINRQRKAKVRTLFYDEQNKLLWWSEPGAGARGTTHRLRSSSLLSRRKESPLPVATLLEVRMASELGDPFCFDEDVDKSFQLVFPQRTVDLVARDADEAVLLARGFQELKASVI